MDSLNFSGTEEQIQTIVEVAEHFGWKYQNQLGDPYMKNICLSLNDKADLKKGKYWFPSGIATKMKFTDVISAISSHGKIAAPNVIISMGPNGYLEIFKDKVLLHHDDSKQPFVFSAGLLASIDLEMDKLNK